MINEREGPGASGAIGNTDKTYNHIKNIDPKSPIGTFVIAMIVIALMILVFASCLAYGSPPPEARNIALTFSAIAYALLKGGHLIM